MNADRLLALYNRVADAPDAIIRLRRFILDLAVRGKLVERNPVDEPASILLKRIMEQKAQLVQAGEIKKSSALPPPASEELPFSLPIGWAWSRIGDVCSKTGSGSTPRGGKEVYKSSGIRFLRSQNVYDDGLRLDDVAYIELKTHERMGRTKVLAGDLLLNITGGSIGRCCRVPDDFEDANVSQHVAIVRPALRSCADFLHRLILSPYFQAFIFGEQTGAGRGGLPKNRMDKIVVPLPPLAEQHRIVAKVDELMALCDRLEAARAQREATRDRLTAASLARLSTPDTDAETFRTHARFTLDTLPALTTRPDQIKALRLTILSLAVRGKLVEQDPTDEPASELLERIAAAKAALKRETGDPRIKPAADAEEDSLPISIPAGWSVQSFENLFLFIDYRGKTPPKTSEGIPLITAKNVRMGNLNREPREFIAKTTFKAWMTRGFPKTGDLFFTTEAPLANICLNDITEPFALAQRVICFQPYAEINTRFLMFSIMSDVMQDLIGEYSTGLTAKGIKAAKLKPLPLPIPPLAEQHRIVAKVDALMALCDQLEKSLAAADTARRSLLEALLHDALAPATEALEAA